MLQYRFKWALPNDFHRVSVGYRQFLLVANGEDENALAESILRAVDSVDSETQHVGRTRLRSIRLADGGKGLIRNYWHGGIFRHWTRDWFFTWPPRPVLELIATQEARRRGLVTLDVIAAFVACGWGPFYRGWLVTRELENAKDLWHVVQDRQFSDSRTALMGQAGKAVRVMHEVGVYHADLNLRNLLVRREAEVLEVFIIDLDRAGLYDRPVPDALRHRNLERLMRSVKKLDPERHYVSDLDWNAFLATYYD